MKSFYSFAKLISYTREFVYTISDNTLYLFDSKGRLAIRTPNTGLTGSLADANCTISERTGLIEAFYKNLETILSGDTYAFRDTGFVLPYQNINCRAYRTSDFADCTPTIKLVDRKMVDIFNPESIISDVKPSKTIILYGYGEPLTREIAILSPVVVGSNDYAFGNAFDDLKLIVDTFNQIV